ncbi:NAD(P)-dependent oxidoreductase [uncultured Jatrophihabitans sp.]|uniref:NAD(P)-dependent oxidoreductase n=1 Tax=uncultured Jatrophihabitans sp. TaxID=1610747 RepID=UPI0035CA7382
MTAAAQRVLLVGASGRLGRHVLAELLRRGHDVLSFVRDPAAIRAEHPAAAVVAGDAFAVEAVVAALLGRTVLVSSVALRDEQQRDRSPVALTRALAAAAEQAGVRWISLGGAGSLLLDDGTDFVDSPDFPAVAAAESRGFRAALHELRDHAPAELAWTVVSPPAVIVPDGPRTGRYRVADDLLVVDGEGRSTISAADLAVAVADEVESAAHLRRRFAVGY